MKNYGMMRFFNNILKKTFFLLTVLSVLTINTAWANDLDEEAHLVSAFGSELAAHDVDTLLDVLLSEAASDKQRSSAAYVLTSVVPNEYAVTRLVELMASDIPNASDWAAAVLGQMPSSSVDQHRAPGSARPRLEGSG